MSPSFLRADPVSRLRVPPAPVVQSRALGAKLATTVARYAPSGAGSVDVTRSSSHLFQRQGVVGLWAAVRLACPPGTLAALAECPARCRDILCLGPVALAPGSAPVDVGARLVEIQKVQPTKQVLVGVPPTLNPKGISAFLSRVYSLPKATFSTARRVQQMAQVEVEMPAGTAPLPDIRRFKITKGSTERRGSLRAYNRQHPRMPLPLLAVPKQPPNDKAAKEAAQRAGAAREWAQACARVAAPATPAPLHATPVGGAAGAAPRGTTAPSVAAVPATAVTTAAAAPAGNQPVPPARADCPPGPSPQAQQPTQVQQQAQGQQPLAVYSPPPHYMLMPAPQQQQQQQQAQAHAQQMAAYAAYNNYNNYSPQPLQQQPPQPAEQQQQALPLPQQPLRLQPAPPQPPSGASDGPQLPASNAVLREAVLAASPRSRFTTLVRYASDKTRKYLSSSTDLTSLEGMTEAELKKYLQTLPMRVGSAESRAGKPKQKKPKPNTP
ncbi:hypothetical protein TSOC_013609 [Tetrabaena socialis]|uniref:Uncharacterized protein n=1 Tax=Tetrabaena socialis TaxID=47790 RepID=A0A2J7ZJY1_9CHLO|nr:hypothetical protein TSOC_013609 [Tetrabaena socialis]|eukprot:PNH00562.1 hypothetical protein TSOC_013609 [Tetrabaena socialis]